MPDSCPAWFKRRFLEHIFSFHLLLSVAVVLFLGCGASREEHRSAPPSPPVEQIKLDDPTSFNRLRSLDAATAEKLAAWEGDILRLDGLTTLDAATAEKLAQWGGTGLSLDGLTTLDAATAEKLDAFGGMIHR